MIARSQLFGEAPMTASMQSVIDVARTSPTYTIVYQLIVPPISVSQYPMQLCTDCAVQ